MMNQNRKQNQTQQNTDPRPCCPHEDCPEKELKQTEKDC